MAWLQSLKPEGVETGVMYFPLAVQWNAHETDLHRLALGSVVLVAGKNPPLKTYNLSRDGSFKHRRSFFVT